MNSFKLQIIGIASIAILFIGSIFIRSSEFNKELGGNGEWITAHSLVTMEIWDQNGGPSAFGFNPVYSYPDKVNLFRRSLGGVTDENGLHYYTSYPPFAFIFGYYATQIMGGPSVTTIRILNYLIHFTCGLILFLILFEFMPNKDRFNLAGVIAAALYFYSVGFLWGHGFLYFSDTLLQLLLLLCIYTVVRFWKEKFERMPVAYGLIFLLFFLATYTEWLGLFFSFFAGIFFLVYYFISKKKSFLIGFLMIGIASSLAIGITILQYSSIEGWDRLVEVSAEKYNVRSGHVVDDPQIKYHIEDEASQELLEDGLGDNYKGLQNLVGAFAILFIPLLFIKRLRTRITKVKIPLVIVGLLLISILLHYYLFYNFNALHLFSGLKTGLLLTMVISTLILFIFHSMPTKQSVIICGLLISGFVFFRMASEVKRYNNYVVENYVDFGTAAQQIGENASSDKASFANAPFHPINLYNAKGDWFNTADTGAVSRFMDYFKVEEAEFFLIVGKRLVQKQECSKYDGNFRVIKTEKFVP